MWQASWWRIAVQGSGHVQWLLRSSRVRIDTRCRGSCAYQGHLLPSDVISQYPDESPGMWLGHQRKTCRHKRDGLQSMCQLYRYGDFPNIGVYGTSCAAWDFVPGTPHYGFPAALMSRSASGYLFPTTPGNCSENSNWSSPLYSWCQLPW